MYTIPKKYAFYSDNDIEDNWPLFYYMRLSELPEEDREPFKKWLEGQQLPIVPDVPDAFYAQDYRLWIKEKTHVTG